MLKYWQKQRSRQQALLECELERIVQVLHIPTSYPNGLSGGIPAQAFDAEDAERELTMCGLCAKLAY